MKVHCNSAVIFLQANERLALPSRIPAKGENCAGWNRRKKTLAGAAVFTINLLRDLGQIASSFFLSLFLHLQTWDGDGFFLCKVLCNLWKKNLVLSSRAVAGEELSRLFFFFITVRWLYHRVK